MTKNKERLEKIENLHPDCIQELRDMLDECCEPVKIGTLEYLPSRVLETVDPVAFREEYWSYFNEEIGDLTDKIEEEEE